MLPAAPSRPGVKPTNLVIDNKPPPPQSNYIGPRDANGYPAIGGALPTPRPLTPGMKGLGEVMSRPKVGLGTAMGAMKNIGRAAAGLGKSVGGMKKGGKVSSASKRADGCAVKGKTKGKIV